MLLLDGGATIIGPSLAQAFPVPVTAINPTQLSRLFVLCQAVKGAAAGHGIISCSNVSVPEALWTAAQDAAREHLGLPALHRSPGKVRPPPSRDILDGDSDSATVAAPGAVVRSDATTVMPSGSGSDASPAPSATHGEDPWELDEDEAREFFLHMFGALQQWLARRRPHGSA